MVILKNCVLLQNINQKIKESIVNKVDFQTSKNRYIQNEQEKLSNRDTYNLIMYQHQHDKKRVFGEYVGLKKEIKEYCESLCQTIKLTNKDSAQIDT